MEIYDGLSPLTMAAKLLRELGDTAPYDAMNRCKTYEARGETSLAAYWSQVAMETIDAVTATSNDKSE